MSIQTGSSVGGNGGDIILRSGPSTEGAPGSIQLVTGSPGRGGDISLRATGQGGGGPGRGGDISLSDGGQGSHDTGGKIHFQSGPS